MVEVHPPVDGEGQTIAPDMGVLSRQLDRVLGSNTVAIHWDFARQALQAATGMPTLVGLQAEADSTPVPASNAPHPVSATTTPAPSGP